jgi:dephospho-CoA kinase
MKDGAKKIVVGLTGGIASGKSTALKQWEALGWSVISADSLVSETLASDLAVLEKIKRRWGDTVLLSCGSIDKAAVGRIVFGKKLERLWIEDLLHPIVRSKWISFVQSCSSPKCMVELPLLFEKNLQHHFTHTISMFAPQSTVLNRLALRGLSPEDSRARIAAQLPSPAKAALADFVLWGDGSLEHLLAQIKELPI